jgi:hypothetical protein
VVYRGIALDPKAADADIAAIRESGQIATKSFWKHEMANPDEVRSRAAQLALNPRKIREEINRLPQMPLTYACGDEDGASRYALSVHGKPVVIAMEISLEDVIIDGRDFLYPVFQLWDRSGISHRDCVRANLSKLYGPTILEWFDRASQETDTDARIGLCDLAARDRTAIERHLENRMAVAGRHHRIFRSAFAIPATLDPGAILDIREITMTPNKPSLSIDLFNDMLTPGDGSNPH